MLPRPLSLSASGLARIIQRANIGTLHLALTSAAVWHPADAERELEQRASQEFGQLGLLLPDGRPHPELAGSLAVLCRPAEERYGWIVRGGHTRGVLAGAIGREAILAVRDGEDIWLNQIKPEYLDPALVGQFPELPKARGEVLNATGSELAAASSGRAGEGVRERPVSGHIRKMQQFGAIPTIGGAELHAGRRDGRGGYVCTTHPLRIVDTEHGRWENVTMERGRDVLITIAPAGPGDIANRLRQLRQAL